MNYWHMQLHPNDREEVNRDEVIKIITEKKIIGLGAAWENDRGQPQKFSDQMEVGDIVLIRSNGPLALVTITGDCVKNENDDVWFDLKRTVNIISLAGDIFKHKYKEQFKANWSDSFYLPTTLEIANNSEFIKYWHNTVKNEQLMTDLISLLKHKKQVILHGPPGTGKTRLAKDIAKEMTKELSVGNPEEKLNSFLDKFDSSNADVIKRRESEYKLLNDFQRKFPKQNLKNLTLDEYAFGKGDNDSFCWWIEYGLWELGGYSGQAGKFKIYWKKEINSYKKSGFLDTIHNDLDAMTALAEQLFNVANETNFDEALQKLSKGFVLKILHSYHPEKYFPINNEKCINNALKVLRVDFTGLNLIEKNLKLQQAFEKLRAAHNSDITNVEFMGYLFESFNLQGEIEFSEKSLITKGKYKIIQFHPAYSYEDFVRGITAKTNASGGIYYEVENRILAEYAEEALRNPSSNFVLIIDEINRGNLPAVLGELIYALEYRFDEKNPKETSVESIYSLKRDEHETNSILRLPSNLFIIGTMNTADRSAGHIDYAIRRRFAFYPIFPDVSVVNKLGSSKAVQMFNEVQKLFVKDETGTKSEYLSPDFDPNDVMLGHSYFLEKENSSFDLRLEYEIKPLLREYVKDGILTESALLVINKW